MQIITTKKELQAIVTACKTSGKTIGLVPTMGALHAGHASLVERAVNENNVCFVSVFVNPTQFNNKEDLAKYPRDINRDAELLQRIGADFVFAPTPEEMYTAEEMNSTFAFDFAGLDTMMEGKMRPGHFNGVVQVVSRLFYLVQPDKAYFGEKDWQQIAVVKAMVNSLRLGVEIVSCDIVRESDGLAMSSRNTLLTSQERSIAPAIYKVLKDSITFSKSHTVAETHNKVVEDINAVDGLEVEYFEIVDGNTLLPVYGWDDSDYIVGCITVYCGNTPIRLIDHIKYIG